MKRAVHGSILILAAVLLLAACSGIGSLGSVDVDAGVTPRPLVIQVDAEGGVTVPGHEVVFSAAPGSVAALATGFDVTYYALDGEPLLETVEASTFTNRNVLVHPIPAGVTCDASVPCRASSPDASFVRVASDPLEDVVTVPGPIAEHLLASGDTAGYAGVTVFATSDAGVEVEIPFRVQLTFTYPVDEGA